MKKTFIIAIALVALLTGTATWLTAAPTIGATASAPTTIPVGVPTAVTITSVITDPTLIPTSVNLIRLGTPAIIIGQLRDDGTNGDATAGDRLFTARVTLNQTSVGEIRLQVSAAFRGILQRSVSSTLNIAVLPVGLTVPPFFELNALVLSQGGPIALNNFGNQYMQGGVIPPGGAEIDITTVPLPLPPLSNFIALELQGSNVTSTDAIVVSGVSCVRAFYTDAYTPTLIYSNEALYCPSGQSLHKLFLTYRAGDPKEAQFLSSFQQLLSSIQLAP